MSAIKHDLENRAGRFAHLIDTGAVDAPEDGSSPADQAMQLACREAQQERRMAFLRASAALARPVRTYLIGLYGEDPSKAEIELAGYLADVVVSREARGVRAVVGRVKQGVR